ncbi:MAG: dephospho-CoA kinase [Cytophagales bacterium]|nr:dephospho-CoA kinase [Cytophagales bacterium]
MSTKKIGITGGIGVGKTIVAQVFEVLGVPIYNADQRAKYLMNNDPILKAGISKTFGSASYQDNTLNRDYIAKQVFANRDLLNQLNQLVHPCVTKDFDTWCEKHSDKDYVLKEAALLYETGGFKQLDAMIVIDAPLSLRIERIHKRDPFRNEEEIKNIIEKQMDNQEKVAKADYVISNDEQKLVISQVLDTHNQLVKN